MTYRRLIAAALATVGVAGCGGPGDASIPAELLRPTGPRESLVVRAPVQYVVDGDTVIVRLGGHRTHVRLLGIDTPESVKRDSPVECFGPQAAERARELMPVDSVVTVETDLGGGDRHDQYGRLLAYVTPAGQRATVNARLLREGFADLYVFHQDRPFARAERFRRARDAARAERRGMWGACPSRTP